MNLLALSSHTTLSDLSLLRIGDDFLVANNRTNSDLGKNSVKDSVGCSSTGTSESIEMRQDQTQSSGESSSCTSSLYFTCFKISFHGREDLLDHSWVLDLPHRYGTSWLIFQTCVQWSRSSFLRELRFYPPKKDLIMKNKEHFTMERLRVRL